MFTCRTCGKTFSVRGDILERYPGWTPSQCMECREPRSVARGGELAASATGQSRPSASKRRDMPIEEVLSSFTGGPTTGVFTDGAAEGNPGPGGWGAVLVVDDEVIAQDFGSEPHTTNNRMELTAMIAGLRMIPHDAEIDVYTDSQLVVNILTQWAAGWEARGWRKRSAGPIANLELVKEAYALARQRPKARIRWVPAHSGYRWNEYADALATAYRRERI